MQALKQQCSSMAAVLPFASTTIVKASSSTQAEIYFGLAKAVDVSGSTAGHACMRNATLMQLAAAPSYTASCPVRAFVVASVG